MNIAQVVAWKFGHQPGMQCQLVDGSLQLVKFPGGIPDAATQAAWTAEYQAWLSSTGPVDLECANSLDTDKMRKLLFEVNFDQENRVRALEGIPTITRAQYRTGLIAVWRTL